MMNYHRRRIFKYVLAFFKVLEFVSVQKKKAKPKGKISKVLKMKAWEIVSQFKF